MENRGPKRAIRRLTGVQRSAEDLKTAGPFRIFSFFLYLSVLSAALFGISSPTWAGTKLTSASIDIPRDAERAGGQIVSGGAFILNNTVGEVGTLSLAGGSVQAVDGLMNVESQPGSVVAITAVTKATTTLELSWTAPGLDGFQGNVVGGYYRIDYSSDVNHAFAPTNYRLEFSTTVAAGAQQNYQIGGLLPNTTYYARIYLADARKYFADVSAQNNDSTLADVPVNPVVTSISSDTVSVSWQAPVGGAEGFESDASSTSFGSLSPGGSAMSSSTVGGLQLSVTMTGLAPNSTYYFKIASINWQGDKNFTAILAVVTGGSGRPRAVFNLAQVTNPLLRTVTLTWANPLYVDPTGVTVVLSTSPAAPPVTDGPNLTPGQVLSDASVVKSTVIAASFQDSGLTLDTTYYYSVYSQGQGQGQGFLYSVSVSTVVFLDLPPMAPAGLVASSSNDHSKVTLTWKPVTSNGDGSMFRSTATPQAVELARYDVYRSTSILAANYVKIASVPASALSWTDAVPDPNQTYLYKVQAVDSFESTGTSMGVDSGGGMWVFAADGVSHLQVPASLQSQLLAGGNPYGSDLLVKAEDEAPDAADKVFHAVKFQAYTTPAGTPVDQLQFKDASVEVALHYEVAGGQIVPTGVAGPAGAAGSALAAAAMRAADEPRVSAGDAVNSLGMYWYNGSKWVKLYGAVDPLAQTVRVKTAMSGNYQVRALSRTQGVNFDLSNLSNKVITPNGDGLNDAAIFTFDNPRDSAVSGKIFDMTGAAVADMTPGPIPNTLQWDGRAGGRAVSGGVYVYQIRGEDKVFTGTLLVIR